MSKTKTNSVGESHFPDCNIFQCLENRARAVLETLKFWDHGTKDPYSALSKQSAFTFTQ